MKVREQARCDAVDELAAAQALPPCLVDCEGWVYILKAQKQLLSASQWKRRFARLRGPRLTWMHAEVPWPLWPLGPFGAT